MPQRLPLSTRARPPLKRAKDPAGGMKFYLLGEGAQPQGGIQNYLIAVTELEPEGDQLELEGDQPQE